MNSKFKKNFKFDNGQPRELGKFYHMCEDLVVVKLSHSDIPYPNAPVLNSEKKVIGKIEEVLGPQDEVYVAVKLDKPTESFSGDPIFFSYDNKFIPKERFLVRSEVEKKKEEGDKKGKRPEKRSDRMDRGMKGDRGRFDGHKGGSDRRGGERKPFGRPADKRKPFKKFNKSK